MCSFSNSTCSDIKERINHIPSIYHPVRLYVCISNSKQRAWHIVYVQYMFTEIKNVYLLHYLMPSTLIHVSAHRSMAESVCRENPWTLWQNWNPISWSFVGTFTWLLLNPDTHLSILYQFSVERPCQCSVSMCISHFCCLSIVYNLGAFSCPFLQGT